MTKLIKLIIVTKTWNKLILQSACGDETDHGGKDDDQVKDRDEDETDQVDNDDDQVKDQDEDETDHQAQPPVSLWKSSWLSC